MRRSSSLLVLAVLLAPAGCRSMFDIPSPPSDVPVLEPGPLPDGIEPADSTLDSPDAELVEVGCVIQCYGQVCGDDGCGGTCGTCPAGTQCASDGSQCIVEAVQVPLGGACGPTADCYPNFGLSLGPFLDPASASWPGCQDDQCREGPCIAGVCSRRCVPARDVVGNGTGLTVPDGIEDDGAPAGDCLGALDTRFAGAWACVEEESPDGAEGAKGRCLPRSSFTPCLDGTPCPAGEACGYLKVRGNLEGRCLAERSDGGGLAAPCGWDPRIGGARGCLAWACSDQGCTTGCAGDGGCLTASARCDTGRCVDGGASCTVDDDCSAWVCRSGVPLAEPRTLFTACAPRTCRIDPDCRDPAFYCRHDPALMVASEPTDPWGRCVLRTVGGAGPGQACNATPGNGLPNVPCANEAYCLDGRCGSLCQADADCGPGQRCGLRQVPVDSNGDGEAELPLQVAVCLTVGDPAPPCTAQQDCASGACTPYVPSGAAPSRVDLVCVTPLSDARPIGASCGAAAFGATCQTGACLFEDATNGVPGICSAPCRTLADCPGSSPWGSGTVRWTCEALPFAFSGTRVTSDDLWVSWCVPVPGDSSLAPCDEALACADPGEYCRSTVRTGAPGGVDEVRQVCVKPSAGAGPGQVCDPSRDGADCATRQCEATSIAGVGFCSRACRVPDVDCSWAAGWAAVCAPRVVVPRTDPAPPVTISLCRQPGACVACRSDLDCGLGLICLDASAVPFERDLRCAKPCSADEDCAGEAVGTTCTQAAAPFSSSATGRAKACLPLACP